MLLTLIPIIFPVVVVLELVLRLKNLLEKLFVIENVTRKDFLAEGYQDYVNWVEDWSKPMFHYLPIGFRLFNLDNPIPEKVNNNSLGFRCDDFKVPNDDTFNVVILGGSAAWGCGASSNEFTIAGQLEKLLNADDRLLGLGKKTAKCYNLAQVNGYQTQDILSLIFFAPRIKPDLVVSLTGWNELMSNYTMNRQYLERYRMFYMDEMEGWEPSGIVGNKSKAVKEAIRSWAVDSFELIKHLDSRKGVLNADYNVPVHAQISLGSELFVEHLITIANLSKAYGYKHFQFMQPYVYRKRLLTPDEQQIVELYDHARPVHGGVETGDYLRGNNIYRGLLQNVEELNGAAGSVTDLCDVFQNEPETMFYTLVHLNDLGYEKIAKSIYETILSDYLSV